MKKIKFSIVMVLLISATTYAQNVGINSTGATPNSSAQLDLNTGNTYTSPNGRGLLIPNVALTGTGDNVTCSATPATSLFVYNTATAGASPTNVVPGFYYWNGAKWVAFAGTGGNDWSLTGNAGTTVGTNFLGTTDNNDLQFNVNNSRSGLIDIASYETFFGYQAGLTTTGILNTFIGYQSGKINTTGTGNTGIGYNSIQANISGTDNSAIGVQTLYYTTGSSNVALGTNAGFSVNSGSGNTALGFWAMNNAGNSVISGSNNTSVGRQAGNTLTTGSYNSFLGYLSSSSAGTYTNVTGVGSYSYPDANDVLVLGSIAGTNGAANSAHVGIGTSTPTDALVVKVPAGSAINCITADVSAGNGTGNALNAISTGNVSYSTVFAQNTPAAVAGTGFDISLSHHAVGAEVILTTSSPYAFAVHGEVVNHANPCGGVIGYYSPAGAWGALGYRNIAGTANYGVYATTALTVGAGRMSGTGNQDNASSVGIGAYGDLFGGWIQGNVYGLVVKGERVSLYVDGKTVVNQPIIQLSKTADNRTIVNYTPASTTADLQLHGVAKMENGVVIISIDQETLNQFISTEDLTIIATPTGQTNGVYAELRGSELSIKENNGGKSNTKVSWIIIGERNITGSTLPDEIKDKDFDTNLRGFMHNENDKSTTGTGLFWDGTKLSTSGGVSAPNTGTPLTPEKKH